MTIAVVGKLVVRRRKLLKALSSDGCEIAFEIGELNEDYRTTSDETIDQRLLRHFLCLKKRRESDSILRNRSQRFITASTKKLRDLEDLTLKRVENRGLSGRERERRR